MKPPTGNIVILKGVWWNILTLTPYLPVTSKWKGRKRWELESAKICQSQREARSSLKISWKAMMGSNNPCYHLTHTSGKTHWQHWHGIYFSEIAFSHIEVPRVKGLFVAFSFCLHSWQQGFYNSCEWHRSKFLTKQKSLYYSTLLDRGKRC